MGKIKRGNYLFISWKGDHSPRHVHIYKNGKLIAKWDLENFIIMEGEVSRRVLKIIKNLVEKGEL